MIVAVGGIVASIGQILPRKIVGPPSIVRNGPPSGLKNLLNETTSKKKGQITIMLSLVPKSKFLKFPQPLHYKKGQLIWRQQSNQIFKKIDTGSFITSRSPPTQEEGVAGHPIRCSDNKDIVDLIIDSDSYDMKMINERSLSCYCTEQFWVEEDNKKILLLVNIDGDITLFCGMGKSLDDIQNLETNSISGKKHTTILSARSNQGITAHLCTGRAQRCTMKIDSKITTKIRDTIFV